MKLTVEDDAADHKSESALAARTKRELEST